MRDVLTPEQVAEYLQLSKDTIYRLIRQKKLAATQIGRTYRVPREDLENFLFTYSSRAEVREALFNRALEIGRRNPDTDSDQLLEELERTDEEERSRTKSA